MALLESVSGFRDLFTDPPEFDILQVSRRQQFSNFVRITLGGLALILLALQGTGTPILCFAHRNQTKITNAEFIHEECIDDIKGREGASGNAYLVLDEYLGWILTLEIICIMVITKVIARNEKSKQKCRKFTELSETILNAEKEQTEGAKGVMIDQGYILNQYNVFLSQLRKTSQLSNTHLLNSLVCIVLALGFFTADVFILYSRNEKHQEKVMCKVTTTDGNEIAVDCLFPAFETLLYIGIIFSALLLLEIFIQISLFVKFKRPRKKEGKHYGNGKIQTLYELLREVAPNRNLFDETVENCDLFLLWNCLRHKYDDQAAYLVLAVTDKNVRRIWSSLVISPGDSPRSMALPFLTFKKEYSEVIRHVEKAMKNIKLCCKAKDKVKFNLPVIEILDVLKEEGTRMGIQADHLDVMEIVWNRHIIYQNTLGKKESLRPYVIGKGDVKLDIVDGSPQIDDDVAWSAQDSDEEEPYNDDDVALSRSITPPPESNGWASYPPSDDDLTLPLANMTQPTVPATLPTSKVKENEDNADIREAFKLFDKDGDGFITCEEMKLAMSKLENWKNMSKEEVDEMIRKADLDGDGKLDYTEFRILSVQISKDA